jgi:hypothetical protein
MKFNYFSILFNILPLGKSSVILQEALLRVYLRTSS